MKALLRWAMAISALIGLAGGIFGVGLWIIVPVCVCVGWIAAEIEDKIKP